MVIWATVGNGALSGAGSGGVNALISGQNFLEGLVKGAVVGGAIGAVSYKLGKLFNNPNGNQPVAEIKKIYQLINLQKMHKNILIEV